MDNVFLEINKLDGYKKEYYLEILLNGKLVNALFIRSYKADWVQRHTNKIIKSYCNYHKINNTNFSIINIKLN